MSKRVAVTTQNYQLILTFQLLKFRFLPFHASTDAHASTEERRKLAVRIMRLTMRSMRPEEKEFPVVNEFV